MFAHIVVALLLAAPAVPTAAPVPKGGEQKTAVAYVYNEDQAGAAAFKKFLDGEGFAVVAIGCGAVGRTDFTKFALVVIGSDTDKYAWAADAKIIHESGKPVLALGEGGYTFLGRTGLKLAIGAPQGWHGKETGVRPLDAATSPLWKDAGVRADKAIKLYEKSGHVGIHLPKPPGDVVLLGREEKNDTHYPLVRQGKHNVLWGFTGGPEDMTADGRKVFVATCRYTVGLAAPVEKKP